MPEKNPSYFDERFLNKPVTARQARLLAPAGFALSASPLFRLFTESTTPPSPYAAIKEGETYTLTLPNGHTFTPGGMIYNDYDGFYRFYREKQSGNFDFYHLSPNQRVQVIRYHSLYTSTKKRMQKFTLPGDHLVQAEQTGAFYKKPLVRFGNQLLRVEGVLVRSVADIKAVEGMNPSQAYDRRVLSFFRELQNDVRIQDKSPYKTVNNYMVTCYPPYFNSGVGEYLLVIGLNRVK